MTSHIKGLSAPIHTAVWIDDDLYFEKTNSSPNDPFRLNTTKGVTEAFVEADPIVSIDFYRMKEETEELPKLEAYADRYEYDLELFDSLDEATQEKISQKFICASAHAMI